MRAPSTASPKRVRRDAELNREKILQAARELFAEHGLDATLNDVAHRAGVGVGTVYRHFRNRDDLVEALFEENLGRLRNAGLEALTVDDPWAGFVQFMEASVALMAADRGLLAMVTSGTSRDRHVPSIDQGLFSIVTRLVERAQAAGTLRADFRATDIPVFHVMLGAGADFVDAAVPLAWRRHLVLVLDGLRSDPDPNSPLPNAELDDAELDVAMKAWQPGKRRSRQIHGEASSMRRSPRPS